MKTCTMCSRLKAFIAQKGRLLSETTSGKVITRKIFLDESHVYFCIECGRAIRRDSIEHKKEVLEDLIAKCGNCEEERRKRENSN